MVDRVFYLFYLTCIHAGTLTEIQGLILFGQTYSIATISLVQYIQHFRQSVKGNQTIIQKTGVKHLLFFKVTLGLIWVVSCHTQYYLSQTHLKRKLLAESATLLSRKNISHQLLFLDETSQAVFVKI